jgi:Zn-finger nucleic acid-binding protein
VASSLAANVEKPDDDYLKLFKVREVASPDCQHEARLCPECQAVMREFNFAYDSNIFLDKCPRCGGIWTDVGEILKVAQHLKMDPRIYEVGQSLLEESPAMRDIRRTEIAINIIYRIALGLCAP